MKKIRVFTGISYRITSVTEDTYKIIQRKVIESIDQLQWTQDITDKQNLTLERLMETCITMDIYEQSIRESTNLIKNK